MNTKKLHFGCGAEYKEGFINLDRAPQVKTDILCNMEKGLPFPDNTFEYIYSKNVLQQIHPAKFRFVLSEISRVAKPNCVLEMVLPFDDTKHRANANHFRVFGYDSFQGFMEDAGRYWEKTGIITLRSLIKRNRLTRWFFFLFPLLKESVHFKFQIVKNNK